MHVIIIIIIIGAQATLYCLRGGMLYFLHGQAPRTCWELLLIIIFGNEFILASTFNIINFYGPAPFDTCSLITSPERSIIFMVVNTKKNMCQPECHRCLQSVTCHGVCSSSLGDIALVGSACYIVHQLLSSQSTVSR